MAFLGVTKRGSDGFGSTGVSVIKKKKLELVSNEVSSEENLFLKKQIMRHKRLLKKQLKKQPLKKYKAILRNDKSLLRKR